MAGLIALDDAHQAHDGHPYVQLMLDHYHAGAEGDRPRVVGLMPNQSPEPPIILVESICDATLFGLANDQRAILRAQIIQPQEIITFYEPSAVKRDTTLCTQLKNMDPDGRVMKQQFAAAAATLRDVGPCASDLVWRRYMITLEQEYRAGEPEPTGDDAADEVASENFRIKTKVRSLLKEWTFTMPNLNPSSKSFNVTPKFAKLIQILQCFEQQGDEFRGLVLVQKRSTAAAVADMLRTIGDQLPFLRPQTLVGQETRPDVLGGMDRAAQRDTVDEFRSGRTNLLVATRVAEDGIEFPQCSVVIRFDLFDNPISYAQSRARADQNHGHFIIMVEQNNDVHRRVVYGVARLDAALQHWVHAVANTPGGVAPPPSLLEKNHTQRVDSDDEEAPTEECILDPTSGGRIYAKDAAGVIYKYVAAHSEKSSSKPLFEHHLLENGQFQCSLKLPSSSPFRTITGSACKGKYESRRAVCYEACQLLYRLGHLDPKFFPRPPIVRSFLPDIYSDFKAEPDWEARSGPKVPNAQANVNVDATGQLIKGKTAGTRCYVRKRPAFWKNSLTLGFSGQLFPTVIQVDLSGITPNKHRTLCIFSRHALPPIEAFRIFHSGSSVEVSLRRCEPFDLDEQRLHLLHRYTVLLLRTVAGKPIDNPLERTPYLLAPMQSEWELPTAPPESPSYWRPDVQHGIEWEAITAGVSHWFRPLKRGSVEELEGDLDDAMIQDRKTEFSRRFDAVRLRKDLTPRSKPEGLNKDMPFQSYIDLCFARRKGFEGLEDEQQPMIEATAVGEITNRLNPSMNSKINDDPLVSQYLIPELTVRHSIASSVYRTALLFPSIIRRVDDYLLVKELNAKVFDNWLQEKAVLTAITAPSAAVEFDFERQELLGDAYLKYLSSIYLFVTYPTQQEGQMHIARQRIISNRSLLQRAREADVPQYIQAKPFAPKLWVPYNYKFQKRLREEELVEGADKAATDAQSTITDPSSSSLAGRKRSADEMLEGDEVLDEIKGDVDPKVAALETENQTASTKPRRRFEDTRVQWLGDKCVADVAEALIGAAVITGGIESALKISKDLGCYLPRVDRWSDFGRKVLAPPPEWTAELSAESITAIEMITGYSITKPHIIAQALTHTSIHGTDVPCYERLEFLGDAVLDYLVIGHIFDLYGSLSPGALTLLKGSMVTNLVLAALCVEIGLYKYMIFENDALGKEIEDYVAQIQRAQALEYKIADNEGRLPGQYWVDIEPPKPLSDIVESTLGAILVLDNFNSKGTERMYQKVLKPFFERHISLDTLAHHPTKVLFEMFQGRGCQSFEIQEAPKGGKDAEGNEIPEVIVHDVIVASTVDTTLSLATRRSCYMALDAIAGDPGLLDNLCECRAIATAAREAKRKALKAQKSGDAPTAAGTNTEEAAASASGEASVEASEDADLDLDQMQEMDLTDLEDGEVQDGLDIEENEMNLD
ncbi:hypothetical protein DL93DRAFT_2051002 [Clavulina sp. PMI_390]|nr:hypothetical protein DL93DRAFT_2051002 [Clavulina sp. PMI_390]